MLDDDDDDDSNCCKTSDVPALKYSITAPEVYSTRYENFPTVGPGMTPWCSILCSSHLPESSTIPTSASRIPAQAWKLAENLSHQARHTNGARLRRSPTHHKRLFTVLVCPTESGRNREPGSEQSKPVDEGMVTNDAQFCCSGHRSAVGNRRFPHTTRPVNVSASRQWNNGSAHIAWPNAARADRLCRGTDAPKTTRPRSLSFALVRFTTGTRRGRNPFGKFLPRH